MIVILDATVLGVLTNPKRSTTVDACSGWLDGLLASGVRVRVPEIADYEVRREQLRRGATTAVRRLDQLAARIGYLELTTVVMNRAAELWAEARARRRRDPGRPGATLR